MSGQCYQCGSNFSFFKKEVGCKNCGFSFCSKCIQKKAPIPKLNNEKHLVCDKCFNILSGKEKKINRSHSPPEAYKKMVAANKDSSPSTYRSPRSQKPKKDPVEKSDYAWSKGLEREDLEIANRLQKLKEDRKKKEGPIPDRHEIEERLSKLKGIEAKSSTTCSTNKKFYIPPNTKGSEEQTLDLLDEIFDEVEIDSRQPKPEDEIASRLNQLRSGTIQPKDSSHLANNLNRKGSHSNEFLRNIKLADGIDESSRDADEQKKFEEFTKYIQQAAIELEIDAQKAVDDLAKDNEIMNRLQKLKEANEKEKSKSVTDADNVKSMDENADGYSSEEDEEVLTKRLIKQLLAENKLEETNQGDIPEQTTVRHANEKKKLNTMDPSEDEELPWCYICNADAVLKCIDCDDLYCLQCFREGHKDFDMRDHLTVPFRKR